MVAHHVEDGDDPFPPFPGLAVRHRAKVRANCGVRKTESLLRTVAGERTNQMDVSRHRRRLSLEMGSGDLWLSAGVEEPDREGSLIEQPRADAEAARTALVHGIRFGELGGFLQ
jgi:hypothetical protein